MIATALTFAVTVVCIAMALNLYRLIAGPLAVDRLLALDTLVVNSIALIVLFGMVYATTVYFEAALLFATVAFVGTIAFCKYLLRGNVIE
ncbi:MAG: cation:proton antiporter [Alphaproteobacteria bacterium BRH_c36]|nr:MAG: cation:proton antiporter [Alphaproteobacteria bacterium BRH_c36]KUO67133.1 MAG: cation:proton antiporter [Alphaproteobacteria bacterium BRH_c36]